MFILSFLEGINFLVSFSILYLIFSFTSQRSALSLANWRNFGFEIRNIEIRIVSGLLDYHMNVFMGSSVRVLAIVLRLTLRMYFKLSVGHSAKELSLMENRDFYRLSPMMFISIFFLNFSLFKAKL